MTTKDSFKIPNYIVSINGLRAISVLLVVMQHVSMMGYSILNDIKENKYLSILLGILMDGQLGVNTFFVISGFLITYLLLIEERKTSKINIKNFYIRRFFRIFPAYYFLLFIYFILQSLDILKIPKESWLTAITYTKYFNYEIDSYTAHAWSLSIEEQFYLTWPFVFLLGHKTRRNTALFLIVAAQIFRMVDYRLDIGFLHDLSIFFRIDAIAIGCLLAIYREKLISFFSAKQWQYLFYVSIIILVLLPSAYCLTDSIPKMNIIWSILGSRYGFFANICICVILIYSVYFSKGFLFLFLNNKLMNHIGLLSYSIYLWQQIFLIKTPHWYNQFPMNIILIIIVSHLSYYLIEKPFMKLKAKFSM